MHLDFLFFYCTHIYTVIFYIQHKAIWKCYNVHKSPPCFTDWVFLCFIFCYCCSLFCIIQKAELAVTWWFCSLYLCQSNRRSTLKRIPASLHHSSLSSTVQEPTGCACETNPLLFSLSKIHRFNQTSTGSSYHIKRHVCNDIKKWFNIMLGNAASAKFCPNVAEQEKQWKEQKLSFHEAFFFTPIRCLTLNTYVTERSVHCADTEVRTETLQRWDRGTVKQRSRLAEMICVSACLNSSCFLCVITQCKPLNQCTIKGSAV